MKNTMVYSAKGPIPTSHEGLMLGNGVLGILVYGKERLSVSLDRIDLWDRRDPDEYRDPDFNFAHMAESARNDYAEFNRLFDCCYNHPYPTKLNAGLLSFRHSVSENDEFFLDMEKACFSYSSGSKSLKGYVDAEKEVIVLKYSSSLDYSVSMSAYFMKPLEERGLGYPEFREYQDGPFRFVIQPMTGKHQFGIAFYPIRNGDETSLYITIFKEKGEQSAKRCLLDYVKSETAHLAEHLSYWKNYFGTSSIVTPDERINALYDKGRYYFGCNSRKKYPMTLHGVWTQNNGNLPPWKSDLHNDINVEMTYDAYLKSGNFSEGKVLIDYYLGHRPVFARFATEFMKSPGILIPGVMTQEGKPLGGWSQYALNPAVSIWAIKVFNDYYEYTGDLDFLRNSAYPFFRDTELCIRHCLVLKDGYYELPFHSSPEFYENDQRSLFPDQTNFEITMLRYLYGTLIRYCGILGKDDSSYREIFSCLRTFARDEKGETLISLTEPFSKSHRHFSHLLMHKNLEMTDPYADRDQIVRDIAHLRSFGTSEWVGFSFVESAGLYAYVHDGEHAYEDLGIFEKAFVHPNGFHMNNDYKNLGYSKMTCYVMTLEANLGFVRSLEDMMIQDVSGIVSVFPAIPEYFKQNGTFFRDLRIKNGHRVSGSYENGKTCFSITLSKPSAIRLYNNFGDCPVLLIDGAPVSFEAKEGECLFVQANKTIEFR